MTAIHPRITEVLAHTFKVPAAEILPDSTMDSLEMDSLAVAEFAAIIKETLGIHADPDQLYRNATLADITEFIGAAAVAEVPASGEAATSSPR
ncbi:acyl carrier protein [Streptomyces sp. NPDC058231]|uniref:acyl carrier protein n=1 Tax=Streptomyces sp. NPDC058231 TaxID=3346392 RepID=UPI0036ECEC3E